MRKRHSPNEAASSGVVAVIGRVWVDGSFFGSVYIMPGLDSGDFWVGSGSFRLFWVGFKWFQVLSITPIDTGRPTTFEFSDLGVGQLCSTNNNQ